MPDEFWTLTGGELSAKIRGFIVRRDIESSNHRNTFALLRNINRRKGEGAKSPQELWPLDIDYNDAIDIEERLDWYKKVGKNIKAQC